MLPFYQLLAHSLTSGLILSVAMTALILVTLYWRPMIWVGDAPADVQAAAGPMSEVDRHAKRVAGIVTLGLLLGIVAMSLVRLGQVKGGALTFTEVALSTFIVFMVFNLVDLLLIDWLLVATVRPRFVVLPGTEQLAGYGDYGFYFRGFLKGIVGGVVLSVLVAMLVVGANALV